VSTIKFDQKPRKHPSDGGIVRVMARSGGYVMVRRPRCIPFVLSEKQWMKLELFDAQSGEEKRGD
jgi:hypothetical protein